MSNQPNAARIPLSLYQHDLQEDSQYGLPGSREWQFARNRGHKYWPDINVNIDLYTSQYGLKNGSICLNIYTDWAKIPPYKLC